MALKWLNRLSSLLQHLFDLTAIKTEMMMMMIWKVLCVFQFLQYNSSEFTHV